MPRPRPSTGPNGAHRPAVGRPTALTVLLAIAMAAGNYVPVAMAVLSPFIVADLHLSRAQYGLLLTAPIAVAAVLSTVGGGFVDRVGCRSGLTVLFVCAALADVAIAVAQHYVLLLAAASVSAVASALSNPATNQVISGFIAHRHQGVVIGVKQSGVQLAPLIAGGVLPTIAVAAGWRAAFAGSVALPAAGLLAALVLVPRASVQNRDRPVDGPPVFGPWSRWLTLYALLMGFGVACVTFYLPLYAVQRVGFSKVEAGAASALLGLTAVASRIAWARRLPDVRKTHRALASLSLIGSAAICLLLAGQAVGPAGVWAGAAVFGATASAWNAVANLALVRLFPHSRAGRASGVMQTGFYAGLGAGPIAYGFVVDRTGSYAAGWLMAAGIVAAAAGVAARLARVAVVP